MEYLIPCKINLNLHIIGRREDGYHLLDSLFFPLPSVCDTMRVSENSEHGIKVLCNTAGIDLESNTLTKAYTVFNKASDFSPNIKVELEKNIPHGAGLGGGSADGAFILKYLYMKWKGYSSVEEVEKSEEAINFLLPLAVQVGADVPFFLYNKPMRAEGIGEILTEYNASSLKNNYLLLLCPRIYVNTAQVFKIFKEENQNIVKKIKKNYSEDLTTAMSQAINSLYPIEKDFFVNDLEKTVFRMFPKLGEYKQSLLSQGAKIALMSGSGSSMFALFDKRDEAEKAKAFFENSEDMQLCSLIEL